MNSPTVSVIMPVYNGERFLAEAIDSILVQTFSDFEFIVVNDGSTDSTGTILERYATQDARIRILNQPTNQGIVAALNWGIREARGKYIARMDADDISLPERLQNQITYLQAHPDVGLLGTAVMNIDELGKDIGKLPLPTLPRFAAWSNLFACAFAHPTTMMQRSFVEQVGYYRQEAKSAEDYDLWVRMSQVTQIDNLSEVMLRYRTWPGSITSNSVAEMEAVATRCVQLGVSAVLGQTITLHEAACLRWSTGSSIGQKPTSRLLIQRTADLLMRLYRHHIRAKNISTLEAERIAENMALRMLRIGVCSLQVAPSLALSYIQQAVAIYPGVISVSTKLLIQKVVQWTINKYGLRNDFSSIYN